MNKRQHRQKGAVSIFIVIFAALLITTITVVFVRLMIQNQNQATANDLSRSALDSANAGVEDAKRLLVKYYDSKCDENPGSSSCLSDSTNINGKKCNTIQSSGILGASTGSEVKIKTNTEDAQLNQAYTCVKITLDTDDYIASLRSGESKLIHLKGVSGFNTIELQWYDERNYQSAQTSGVSAALNLADAPIFETTMHLPTQSSWPKMRPALMRLQLLQFGSSFNLSDFDSEQHNASLFLMPSNFSENTRSNFSTNVRMTPSDILQPASCKTAFPSTAYTGGYACSAIIGRPGGANMDAYLRVLPIYNTQSVTFRVCLRKCDDGGSIKPVKFDGVQPEVDSTGRASDYFRRVKSRVEFVGGKMPNIDAAVDITGSLCKVFEVGESDTDFKANSDLCTP
ncbi:hypothetical protein KC953_00350 [Candidatus Saccharibacteria bacterium]|nr:hypothetical protein [Candidatus Saccharibacteria bacterium]